MRDGFVKIATGTPEIKVADCAYNAKACIDLINQANAQGVKVLVLPELVLTGVTCGDLFYQDTLLMGAENGLAWILESTKEMDMLITLGLPVRSGWDGRLYNCAAVINRGNVLALIPKGNLKGEESRWFAAAPIARFG